MYPIKRSVRNSLIPHCHISLSNSTSLNPCINYQTFIPISKHLHYKLDLFQAPPPPPPQISLSILPSIKVPTSVRNLFSFVELSESPGPCRFGNLTVSLLKCWLLCSGAILIWAGLWVNLRCILYMWLVDCLRYH